MNAISQYAVAIVLSVAIGLGGFQIGRKSVKLPRALVYDVASKTWVPLTLKADTKIAVASPYGTEPGVAYEFKTMPKEGPVVLILPPSLIPEPDAPTAPDAPQTQPQSDDPRLDHADLMKISK